VSAPVLAELRLPGHPQVAAAVADALREVLPDALGHQELRVPRPAVEALGRTHLILAQRLAVRFSRVLTLRRPVADVAVDDDERGPICLVPEHIEGPRHHLQVVGVADPGHVPAVADETGGDVIVEGQGGRALDRDVVVVVDPAEVGELQVPGQRRRLAGDPLHMQPSPASAKTSNPNISNPARWQWAASPCEAIAIPTEVATPCPSGPVVVSTPEVHRYSGWPGHLESSWRNRSRSSSSTVGLPSVS